MTCSDVWRDSFKGEVQLPVPKTLKNYFEFSDKMCGTWLNHVRDTTDVYVCYVPHSYVCGTTHSYACDMIYLHVQDMTHSYEHVQDMTHSYELGERPCMNAPRTHTRMIANSCTTKESSHLTHKCVTNSCTTRIYKAKAPRTVTISIYRVVSHKLIHTNVTRTHIHL